MKISKKVTDMALPAVTQFVPVPGLNLMLNKQFRQKVRRATGIALLGAGALVAVPVALYVICKTSEGSERSPRTS